MHLIALVEGPEHVCCRYRLMAFRPSLERAGHRLELRSWPEGARAWLRLGRELAAVDGIIVQRKPGQPWQRYLIRRAARRLLFDFDDAIFSRDSFASRGLQSAARMRRFAAMVRSADAVFHGNAFLRDQAARWTSMERVHVIPTCVDPSLYSPTLQARTGSEVELVWIGSSSTLRGLERARSLLEAVGQGCPGLFLKLICNRFLTLRHLPVLQCPWSEADEAKELATADIGLSWVPDDAWSRGKCGLKVLQYMAAGLPVVANPVGVQAEMVRHGETGFLAETAAEWTEALNRLARAPDLRQRMGRAGRQRLEEHYSVAVGAGRWLALLNGLAQRRQTA